MQDYPEHLSEDEDDDEDGGLFEHYRFTVDKGQTLLRIDKYLLLKLANTSRNRVQNAIEAGFVKVNEQIIKANYKVKPLDTIVIALPQPPRDTEVIPENIPLNIVYEDADLLIVNKPAGMVVHPAYNNWTGTLVNALSYHFQNLPENADGRPGLVHRIDKDTSGLLVIAKTEFALTDLAKQFFDHSIERTYYALVWGEPAQAQGTINVNVGRSLKDRRVTDAFPAGDFGRTAITHYEVIKSYYYVSLVKCNLETGRTHQIRAHFKYLKHPLFNDVTYGGDKIWKGTVFTKYKQFVENCFKIIPRQALHAKSLGFKHPRTGKWMQFDSDLPPDFVQVIEKWENYIKNHPEQG
ncbi:MAG: RluA family pseudouridine synthase [Microscillaceae bacterium]|jgi:23S rRNA pseudouridine1911/1915/1917 synthase|nr:RluA family pseudouridine synthase [Microscillaceae bacterium]